MNAGEWSLVYWNKMFRSLRNRISRTPNDTAALACIATKARLVLRSFSTSFFLVTRFLPSEKRKQVEIIYAAVRFPDELVDTLKALATH